MHKTIFKYILFVLFLCHTFQVMAQIEIKNKVTDFATFAPIEGASIYVDGTTVGSISNSDGNFVLNIPQRMAKDTLVISSIGYRSYKTTVEEFDNDADIFLEEDLASLDEIVLVTETRPKTGNEIVQKAIKELNDNLPEYPYLQKGFIRHKERNKLEYKWLIESAITLYDESYEAGSRKSLKINVDETRKSYDLRNVDSLYAYTAYLRTRTNNKKLRKNNLLRDTIKTTSLVEAIKWNDTRINGLENLFKGKLNMVRNANASKALFGENMLDMHLFSLDTVLVENERKVYKIQISKGVEYVGLDTEGVYNEGFEAEGWIYIDWDTYAIKKIEYQLTAGSDVQKRRSKSLFGTQLNHKLIMTFMEYEEKMYPKYVYYETPKLVNAGDRSSDNIKEDGSSLENKDQFYYNTVQEIVFTEIIQDEAIITQAKNAKWSADIFSPRPYNKEFWDNYNVLLESKEEEQLIRDLTRRAGLFEQ